MKVVLIDYGAGNLFSVTEAFRRLGVEPVISSDPEIVQKADRVVFPGVGHAHTAMQELRKTQLEALIPELKQPVLGICLGMQLMCKHTEEGDTTGLGVFDTNVTHLNSRKRKNKKLCYFSIDNNSRLDLPVPHMGWNDVSWNHNLSTEKRDVYYFVHSYAAEICPESWGVCSYTFEFSAALKKNNFLGVQFHPEKSGIAGEQFLKQFLTTK